MNQSLMMMNAFTAAAVGMMIRAVFLATMLHQRKNQLADPLPGEGLGVLGSRENLVGCVVALDGPARSPFQTQLPGINRSANGRYLSLTEVGTVQRRPYVMN